MAIDKPASHAASLFFPTIPHDAISVEKSQIYARHCIKDYHSKVSLTNCVLLPISYDLSTSGARYNYVCPYQNCVLKDEDVVWRKCDATNDSIQQGVCNSN